MALPSQYARPIARRSYMHRRSRRRHRWPLLAIPVVVVVALAIAAWQWTGRGGGDADPAPGLVTGVGAIAENAEPAPDAGPRAEQGPTTPARGTPEPVVMGTAAPREEDRRAADRASRSTPAGTPARPSPAPSTATPTSSAPAPARAPTRTASRSTSDDEGARRGRAHPPAAAASGSSASTQRTARRVAEGLDLLARNRPVEARKVLTRALASGTLGLRDEQIVRERLTELNERLVFSPEVVDGDPFTLIYTIQSNDALSRLPRKLGVQVHWRFIQHVNRISDPRRIRPGQRLKVVTGPFHAVVHKHAYRLDLYLGDDPERVYVCSFQVGLGEYNSTPEGRFRIRPDSRLENPAWVNPRTRKRYESDDPANPIGEHWIGLVGDEERVAAVEGYGMHGTIEPDSIGRQASMGCIRMRPADVALVWSMLAEGVSTVQIVP